MESTQERVVLAARKLFADNGFRGTTTAEIARAAGVAEGTIYRYFKDKKELFIACVEPALQEIVRRETTAMEGKSPREILRHGVIERTRVIREQMDVFNILLTECKQHPQIAQLLIQQALQSVPPSALEAMHQGVATGALKRPPNPLIMNIGLTAAIWAMLSIGPISDELFAGWPTASSYANIENDLADFVCDALMGHEST